MRGPKIVMSFASACLAIASQAALADQGFALSVWGGRLSAANSGDIPYARETSVTPNRIIDQDLGRGTAFGIALGVNMSNNWLVDLGYANYRPNEKGRYDTNPAVVNSCTLRPVQGLVSDCYDNAGIKIDSKLENFDAAIGKRFVMEKANIVAYGGLRYLKFNQNIDAAYHFTNPPSTPGFEEFPDRDLSYSGIGPRIGAKFDAPLGSSGFFVKGDLGLAQMLTGERKQKIVAPRTNAGVLISTRTASDKDSMRPLTLDASLQLGYNLTQAAQISLGWRYSRVNDILDTRDTNSPAVAGTLPGPLGIGSAHEDFVNQGFFVEFNYRM